MPDKILIHIRHKKFYVTNRKTSIFMNIYLTLLAILTVLNWLSNTMLGILLLTCSIFAMLIIYLKNKGTTTKTSLVLDTQDQDATLLYIISLYCEPLIKMCVVAIVFMSIGRIGT